MDFAERRPGQRMAQRLAVPVASALDTAAKARAAGVEVVAQVIPDPRLFHLIFAAGFLQQ